MINFTGNFRSGVIPFKNNTTVAFGQAVSWKLSLVKIIGFQKLCTKIFFIEKHLAFRNGT